MLQCGASHLYYLLLFYSTSSPNWFSLISELIHLPGSITSCLFVVGLLDFFFNPVELILERHGAFTGPLLGIIVHHNFNHVEKASTAHRHDCVDGLLLLVNEEMSVTLSMRLLTLRLFSNDELLSKSKWLVEIHCHMIVRLRAKTQANLFAKSLTRLLALKLKSELELVHTLLLGHGNLDEDGNFVEHVDFVVIDAKRIVALANSYDLTAITLNFNSYKSEFYFVVTNSLALHTLRPSFFTRVLQRPLGHELASRRLLNLLRLFGARGAVFELLFKNWLFLTGNKELFLSIQRNARLFEACHGIILLWSHAEAVGLI